MMRDAPTTHMHIKIKDEMGLFIIFEFSIFAVRLKIGSIYND